MKFYSGLGLIAQARGDKATAAKYFRAVLARGCSPTASGIQAMNNAFVDGYSPSGDSSASSSSSSSSSSSESPVVDDPGYIALASNLMVVGGPAEYLDYPVWKADADPRVWGSKLEAFGMWVAQNKDRPVDTCHQRDAAATAFREGMQRRMQARMADAAPGTAKAPIMGTRVLQLLGDLEKVLLTLFRTPIFFSPDQRCDRQRRAP
jgi:hypothetical protein